jgi:hypothetical protein
MLIQGLPETFWVVTRPTKVSTLVDILFPCTFSQLMNQVRGGLHEDEIVGIYADEDEAMLTARELLGEFPVRPQDALFAEVVVNVMVKPNTEDISAKDLANAAVEAVRNAVRRAEQAGHEHRLKDQVALGMSEVVELKNQLTAIGSQVVWERASKPGSRGKGAF